MKVDGEVGHCRDHFRCDVCKQQWYSVDIIFCNKNLPNHCSVSNNLVRNQPWKNETKVTIYFGNFRTASNLIVVRSNWLNRTLYFSDGSWKSWVYIMMLINKNGQVQVIHLERWSMINPNPKITLISTVIWKNQRLFCIVYILEWNSYNFCVCGFISKSFCIIWNYTRCQQQLYIYLITY